MITIHMVSISIVHASKDMLIRIFKGVNSMLLTKSTLIPTNFS